MNQKKVVFFNNDILFSIFDEIKNFLHFDIVKADRSNINEFKKKIDSDLVIISKKNNEVENSLIVDDHPIKIEKLIEKINIKFLKDKFNSQSELKIGSYDLNLNSREISKDKIKLDLTEREASLIIFLNQSATPVKIDQLQKEVWDYGVKLETHTVETHIYRLRKKIKQKFNDENFILSSKDGYFLN
tara:strand:+ start:588 stop:1148 length:561 start_codon:yes stop_codon:yes gene_type:complete